MDLKIAPKILNSNQDNNQLLLNAIRNKFDAQTNAETVAFSPPKFNIPLLKIPQNNALGTVDTNKTVQPSKPATQLNQFLLQQLQEKHRNKTTATEFVTNSTENQFTVKFELPILNPRSSNANIDSLAIAINKLKVEENPCYDSSSEQLKPTTIDLTTALATKLNTHQGTPPSRDFIKAPQNDKFDFEIPFIDCDLPDVETKKYRKTLPTLNEYCVTDISNLILNPSLTEPSAIGRYLCIDDNKYSAPLPLKLLSSKSSHLKEVKHNVAPFQFETKSPDDVVLQALNKYQRRHYN